MEGVELCICNNCDTVLIDENPQVGAKKHKLKDIERLKVLRKKQERQSTLMFLIFLTIWLTSIIIYTQL
jgi:hypothetical protein